MVSSSTTSGESKHIVIDQETMDGFWELFHKAAIEAFDEFGENIPTDGMGLYDDGMEMIIDEDCFDPSGDNESDHSDDGSEIDTDSGLDASDHDRLDGTGDCSMDMPEYDEETSDRDEQDDDPIENDDPVEAENSNDSDGFF